MPENQEPAAPVAEYTLEGAVDFCNRAKVVVRNQFMGGRQGIDSPSFSESRSQIVCEFFDKTDLDPSVLPKNKINVSAWPEDDPAQVFDDQASVTTCATKRQDHDRVQVMTGDCSATDGVKSAVVIVFDGSSLFKISHDAFRGGTTSLPELLAALNEIAGI